MSNYEKSRMPEQPSAESDKKFYRSVMLLGTVAFAGVLWVGGETISTEQIGPTHTVTVGNGDTLTGLIDENCPDDINYDASRYESTVTRDGELLEHEGKLQPGDIADIRCFG